MLINVLTYFKILAVRTSQDFESMFFYISICMKGLTLFERRKSSLKTICTQHFFYKVWKRIV